MEQSAAAVVRVARDTVGWVWVSHRRLQVHRREIPLLTTAQQPEEYTTVAYSELVKTPV